MFNHHFLKEALRHRATVRQCAQETGQHRVSRIISILLGAALPLTLHCAPTVNLSTISRVDQCFGGSKIKKPVPRSGLQPDDPTNPTQGVFIKHPNAVALQLGLYGQFPSMYIPKSPVRKKSVSMMAVAHLPSESFS